MKLADCRIIWNGLCVAGHPNSMRAQQHLLPAGSQCKYAVKHQGTPCASTGWQIAYLCAKLACRMPGHSATNATIWGRDHNGSSDCGSKICPGCAVTDALGRHCYMGLSHSPTAGQVMSGLLVRQDHGDQLFTLWSLWSLICISIHHIHSLVHCSSETKVSCLAHCNNYSRIFPDMSKCLPRSPNPRHENVRKLCLWKAEPRCEHENKHGQGAPHMAAPTASHGHLDDVEGHHSAGHFHGSHQNQASHGGTPSNFSRQRQDHAIRLVSPSEW